MRCVVIETKDLLVVCHRQVFVGRGSCGGAVNSRPNGGLYNGLYEGGRGSGLHHGFLWFLWEEVSFIDRFLMRVIAFRRRSRWLGWFDSSCRSSHCGGWVWSDLRVCSESGQSGSVSFGLGGHANKS